MKKYFLFVISLLIAAFSVHLQAQDIQEKRILQPVEMQQDFNYLRKALVETHPGLYKHQTKEAMQYKMDSLYKILNTPMTFFDFYKVVAYLIAEVKCEHTYCNPYSENRMMQWKMIPFQLYFTHNKAYVAVNASTDTSIRFGDEVLSINHRSIDSITQILFRYMVSDGNMESSKTAALQNFVAFNTYYHLFIEQAEVFDLEFKTDDGEVFQRRFHKPPVIADIDKLALANPVNKEVFAGSKRNNKFRKIPYRLEIEKQKNTAIVTIRDFGGEREKVFKQYNDFFNKIKKEKLGNLIINLSDNGGGEEEYACELLSYLIDKPTRFIENEYLINIDNAYLKMSNIPADVLRNINAFIDTTINGIIYVKPQTKYSMELKIFQPKPNRFQGNVYFLVNGGTSSAASTCAANANSHHLATIIGDETAGSFAGGGTVNGLDLTLPNSKITAHTSIVYCTFSTTRGDKDRGVIPDYYFIPAFSEIKKYINTGANVWKEFIYDRIENKTND